MNILVYDLYISGHHPEFLLHLLKQIVSDESNKNIYYFLINSKIRENFPDIFEMCIRSKRIVLISPTDEETCKALTGRMIKQSFSQLRLAQKYAELYHAKKILFMHINILQFGICFTRPKIDMAGILLGQFTRQAFQTTKDKLRYIRRFALTWILTKNRRLKDVYILNDVKSCESLNIKFNTSIFKNLPDPIPDMSISEKIDIRRNFEIPADNLIFLHFGVLDRRKGTLDIIEALQMISKAKQRFVTVIIAGKPSSEDINTQIKEQIGILRKGASFCQVVYIEHYVSNDFKNNLFEQCDIVLMPYKNVEASSGVLGQAIASNKNVILPNYGLLKDLATNAGTGYFLKDDNINTLALAIEKVESNEVNSSVRMKYVEEHTPEIFATTLL